MLYYRWFALGVDFGRSDWRRFRVNNVSRRLVSVLAVLLGGCLNLIIFQETAAHPYLATDATQIICDRENNIASMEIRAVR